MRNELWRLLITETFIKSWDELLLLVIPVVLALAVFIYYRRKQLGADGAWSKCGQRFMLLGHCFLGGVLLLYLVTATVSFARRAKENARYTESLQTRFKDYYFTQRNFTQRLLDFASRVPDSADVLKEMDSFATDLPKQERELLGRAWVATQHKGQNSISEGDAFRKLNEQLYWTDEKLANYRKAHPNTIPAAITFKYTPAQIAEFKKSNWPKLFPMLEKDQWLYIKNQIMRIDKNDRDTIMGFLRDIADVFQPESNDGKPLPSLEKLYETLANKACLNDMQKVECYLEDVPKMLSFYKFSLKHRWWFRSLPLVLIFGLLGLVMVINGHKLVVEGKKKNFK